MIRETTLRLQSLDAPSTPGPSSGSGEAYPSLQRPQYNLGTRTGGVTCGVGRHSTKSLLRRCVKARAGRFPELDRVSPASRKKSLCEKAPPQQYALEEGTTKLSEVPPPNPHELDLDQLRVLIESLQMTVQKLAEHSFGKQKGQHSTDDNNNNNNEHNTNHHNNSHTHNNNNTNNNTCNTTSQESSLSFDLDNANPESEPDLDSPSLVSFKSETGFESLNQPEADFCLGSLGNTTRTIGLSLENSDQATTPESSNSLDQEGQFVGTCWEHSLGDWNPSLGTKRDKHKTKKRVSFAQASLAYKEKKQEQRLHSLDSLSTTSECTTTKLAEQQNLPKLAGTTFSKNSRCSNSLHPTGRRSFSIWHAQPTTTA